MANSGRRRRIFVGIDYGTTNSGIAYALQGSSEVAVVMNWPGLPQNIDLYEKVPSKLAYFHENHRDDTTEETPTNLWGYLVKPSMTSYSWTKLLLDPQTARHDEGATDYVETDEGADSGLLKLPANKTAVGVVSDYLKELYNHCMNLLERQYPELLPVTPIEFWFTVPAMWSPQAKNKTRLAAKKARFGLRPGDVVNMISEPEAGVLAAMEAQMNATKALRAETDLVPGSGLLVCDCGGGTVDLTTYVVKKLEPSLELHEMFAGIGKKCGATFIDRNFFKLMQNRFGDAFTSRGVEMTGPGSRFMDEFQRIKHNFSEASRDSEPIRLKMRDLNSDEIDRKHYNFDEDEVQVSSSDMKECFDPVIQDILGLIEKQFTSAEEKGLPRIKILLLLGGFANSEYLWSKVRSWCEQQNILPIVPRNAWSAIARGAALRGLEGSKVPVTKCRRHYGFTYDRKFDPKLDNDDDSVFEDEKGQKKVQHCMEWIYHKNEEIVSNVPKRLKFMQYYYPGREGKKTLELKLYSCNLSVPPDKRSSQVLPFGSIQVNVDDINLGACEKFPRTKKSHQSIGYRIELVAVVMLGSDKGVMEVEVEWNGIVCGSGKLKFEGPFSRETEHLGSNNLDSLRKIGAELDALAQKNKIST